MDQQLLRVLVVDDEVPLALIMQRLLAREFDVTSTASPVEALTWLTGGASFDVILCDMTMPGLDGTELRDRLRAVRPELVERIVFLTGNATKSQVSEAEPNPVLEKPVDVVALRELIRARARGPVVPEA